MTPSPHTVLAVLGGLTLCAAGVAMMAAPFWTAERPAEAPQLREVALEPTPSLVLHNVPQGKVFQQLRTDLGPWYNRIQVGPGITLQGKSSGSDDTTATFKGDGFTQLKDVTITVTEWPNITLNADNTWTIRFKETK